MNQPFDVHTWLNSVREDGQTVAHRLCFLTAANGYNMTVQGWGFISHDGGHPRGLEQKDALELIYLHGFVSGLQAAGIDFRKVFEPIIAEYSTKYDMPTTDGVQDVTVKG